MGALSTVGRAPESTGDTGRRLSVWSKLAYGFGSIAYGVKDNGFSTFLLLFYNQLVGLRSELVGLAIMAALIVDAFVDPVIGVMSDNLKSRWGRRHPFMYASAIPVAVAYLLLWNPPVGHGDGMTLLWLFGTAILVRTAISAYEVPSAALAAELTTDYNERTSILGYRYLFGWIGGMAMLVLTYGMLLAPTPEYPTGILNPEGYHRYAVVASWVMAGSILLSALGTHALIRTLPPRPEVHHAGLGETFRGLKLSLRNRSFLLLLAAGMAAYVNQGVHFTLVASYLNVFVWLFKPSWLYIYTFSVLIGVLLAFLVTGPVSRRFGKTRTAVVFGLLFIALNAAPFILRHFEAVPPSGSNALLVMLMLFEASQDVFLVGMMILLSSMMADVVEDDEIRNGVRREGLFFAGSFFMQKCATGMGTAVAGIILAMAAFPIGAAPDTVPAASIDRLAMLFVTASIIFGLICAWFTGRFPLDEKGHEERLAKLAERASHLGALPASEPSPPIIQD